MQSDYKNQVKDFPSGSVVKNLPSNAGDKGLIPGHRTEVPHAVGQLSPPTASKDLVQPK